VIIIQYEAKLYDGSIIIGDELIEQVINDVSRIIIIKISENDNEITTCYQDDIVYLKLVHLSEEELKEQMDIIDQINEHLDKLATEPEEEDDEDDVDPEETPNEVFNFPTPINVNMYG
jgi:ArsR family metal-binding transcriptional regulator